MKSQSPLRGAAKLLAGTSSLYILMAACSVASTPPAALTPYSDASSVSQPDASLLQSAADAAHAMIDAMVSPVDAAKASGEDAGSCTVICPAAPTTPQSVESGSRLKRKVLTGTDGSRQVSSTVFHDTGLNTACSFIRLEDGLMHCAPAKNAVPYKVPMDGVRLYTDGTCSTAAIVAKVTPAQRARGLQTVLVDISNPDTGSEGSQIFRLGTMGVSGNLYISVNGVCSVHQPVNDRWNNDYYYIGAAIPASTYVMADESVE